MTETQISEAVEAMWARWYGSGEHEMARGWWGRDGMRVLFVRLSRERVRELADRIRTEHMQDEAGND
jgi:hypothetical protein